MIGLYTASVQELTVNWRLISRVFLGALPSPCFAGAFTPPNVGKLVSHEDRETITNTARLVWGSQCRRRTSGCYCWPVVQTEGAWCWSLLPDSRDGTDPAQGHASACDERVGSAQLSHLLRLLISHLNIWVSIFVRSSKDYFINSFFSIWYWLI